MQDLFPKSEADIEKEYKQRIFLKTLKEGKCPSRRNLFKNIVYLSGLYRKFKDTHPMTVVNGSKYDRLIRISFDNKIKEISENEIFINNLKRYLSNDFNIILTPIQHYFNCLDVSYINNKVRWDLIEYDIITNYPENSVRKDNGFVYIKDFKK